MEKLSLASGWRANRNNLLVLLMLPVYIGVHLYLIPDSLSITGITDSGFVSIITLAFQAGAIALILVIIFSPRLSASKWTTIPAAYAVLIYFLREADMHRLLTPVRITRGTFYAMPDVPLWHKIFAASVILLLLGVLVYLSIKHARLIWQKARALEPWAVALVLWFVVLVTSQIIDKSGLNLSHTGRVVEECFECWAAAFLFLATIQIIPALR